MASIALSYEDLIDHDAVRRDGTRGEMENRIKECQLDLFADSISSATMRSKQLRLWTSFLAQMLICALSRIGLARTADQKATENKELACATRPTQRMARLHQFAQPRVRNMRIDFSGRDIGVTEQGLQTAQIRPASQQMGREGVPQHMRGHARRVQPGRQRNLLDHQRETLPGHRLARIAAGEQPRAMRRSYPPAGRTLGRALRRNHRGSRRARGRR